MRITKELSKKLYSKLEYNFKKSGNKLVGKLESNQELTNEDISLVLKKLEYRFKKSNDSDLEMLKKLNS